MMQLFIIFAATQQTNTFGMHTAGKIQTVQKEMERLQVGLSETCWSGKGHFVNDSGCTMYHNCLCVAVAVQAGTSAVPVSTLRHRGLPHHHAPAEKAQADVRLRRVPSSALHHPESGSGRADDRHGDTRRSDGCLQALRSLHGRR